MKNLTPPPPDPLDLAGIYLSKPTSHCLLVVDTDTSEAVMNALAQSKTPHQPMTGRAYLAKYPKGTTVHFVRKDELAITLRLIRHWQPVTESIRINTGTIDRF